MPLPGSTEAARTMSSANRVPPIAGSLRRALPGLFPALPRARSAQPRAWGASTSACCCWPICCVGSRIWSVWYTQHRAAAQPHGALATRAPGTSSPSSSAPPGPQEVAVLFVAVRAGVLLLPHRVPDPSVSRPQPDLHRQPARSGHLPGKRRRRGPQHPVRLDPVSADGRALLGGRPAGQPARAARADGRRAGPARRPAAARRGRWCRSRCWPSSCRSASSTTSTSSTRSGVTWREGSAVHYALHQDRLVTWLGWSIRPHLTPVALAGDDLRLGGAGGAGAHPGPQPLRLADLAAAGGRAASPGCTWASPPC